MISTAFLFVDLLNPEEIIKWGGLALLLFIIFAETGLFFGFFLPGDSLLFIAGILSDTKHLSINVWLLILLLTVCAVLGTCVGYAFGRWAENYLKNRKENFFYKKKYMDVADDFYKRYGMTAFIMGRFLPIVRTFVPILAGMVRIDFGRFFFFNAVGAATWIIVMVMAGHLLGNAFPTITEHLEIIVGGMVLITTIPLIISWQRNRNSFGKNETK
ncbi:MAG TPA: VTT domain-containing protein [Ohtaekwangia sp.]|uniref:DedA family protein n=1 Tax=Ohtaekwangia sp. TaxID=2066019 RepID=UPI002F944914